MTARRHVLLVGLSGSGKTTIGQRVANELEAPFVDVDAVIVRQAQMPLSRLMGERGEQAFRELERQAVRAVLSDPPGVLSPGGGWAAQPGQLEVARTSALIIYLKAMAITVVKRLGAAEGRPLLAGDNLLDRVREQLVVREPFYARADHAVTTDGRTIEAVTADVVALARVDGGW
jgi:shikimate kinase